MSYIKLTDEGEKRLGKLPFILRYLANYLMDAIQSLINGDCDEDNIASTIGTLQQNAIGRIGSSDTVNYDQASRLLGLSETNRTGLKKLLDKNGIKQVIINNQKCGFLRSEITALRDKLDEDIRKREIRRQNKLKRHNRGIH